MIFWPCTYMTKMSVGKPTKRRSNALRSNPRRAQRSRDMLRPALACTVTERETETQQLMHAPITAKITNNNNNNNNKGAHPKP